MIYTIDLLGAGIGNVIRSTALQGPELHVIERAKTMFRLRTEMAVRAVRVLADDGRVVFRWNGREADR
jgi:hypothetical protein